MEKEKTQISWTIYDLATEFPKNRPVVQARIARLKQMRDEIIMKERGTWQFPKIHPYGMRELFQHLAEEAFVNEPLRRIEKEIKEWQRYLDMTGRKKKQSGRVTENDVARAREYPVNELIEFNRSGFANCIWHNEKTPSLKYYPKTNSVYCHACGQHGDSIAIYQQLHHVLFLQAIRSILKGTSL
jgi:hypothetical protein